MTLLEITRLLCLILWLPPLALLAASAWRTLAGRPRGNDSYLAALFFTALLIVGFVGRWYVAPGDEASWAALYALCGALAVYVLILIRQGSR
ncbi:hypothetical protein PQ455_01410 [Sphingomonas naphthae]|uniref:Uncharacterized protein n=1 Tax=Sphingomonas naphthae TaxID=1813468 RepID=A0ABY7TLK9_9SPHN|nr:hypothetical protein [Sphingomonas naphthae]WCT73918.1 hypothetical protein PQ455_01410 [Sphingomonas naphthae]